jgi:phosphonate metabolism protein PhnN/1,5-bisphosphokinase (PRPP-forming)
MPVIRQIGYLVIFIGSSGSGKDSLIHTSYERLLAENIPIHRVKRWITRPSHHSERFHSVSQKTFHRAIENKTFLLWWHIYSTFYGIPQFEIFPYLSKGKIVLVNLSRAMCTKALELVPKAKIVLIKVPSNLAEERIKRRSREKGKDLEARLKRLHENIEIPFPELVLYNDGTLDTSTEILVEFLRALSR